MSARAKCPGCGCSDCGLPTHNCPTGCGFQPADEDLALPAAVDVQAITPREHDTTGGPPSAWVVVLGSHLPYHASACWVFTDRSTAERFAAFVTAEIDPAQVMQALDPVSELLNWRETVHLVSA